MATVGEAIAATLIAQWNVGTGGTQPDPIQYLVERPERDPNPTVADAIYVWLPLRRTFDPVDIAGVYRNVTYTIRVVCHTKTSSARQLEIENEVDRILNSGTPITGATEQTVKDINDISNRSYSNLPKYISEVMMEVFTAMEVSATAYGTATTTTLTTDDLIVNTSITGNPTAALGDTTITDNLGVNIAASSDYQMYSSNDGTRPQLALQDIATGVIWRFTELAGTLSVDPISGTDRVFDVKNTGAGDADIHIDSMSLRSLLMLGSANATYVPCVLEWVSVPAAISTFLGMITNTGATDFYGIWKLPQPPVKGGLKLYITNLKVVLYDADADDYITGFVVYGLTNAAATVLESGTTDFNTIDDHITAISPIVDCSGYDSVMVQLQAVCTNANDLEIAAVNLECYYAA